VHKDMIRRVLLAVTEDQYAPLANISAWKRATAIHSGTDAQLQESMDICRVLICYRDWELMTWTRIKVPQIKQRNWTHVFHGEVAFQFQVCCGLHLCTCVNHDASSRLDIGARLH